MLPSLPREWGDNDCHFSGGHASVPPCCSPLWGVLTRLVSPAVGMCPPSWGGCAGSIPVPWGAALGAPQCPGGLHHGGLRRGAVPGAVGREGARLRLWHGARNGRSNSCDLLISPLQRVPSPHSSCRQFRGALPVSPAGTHPDKPGCPRPTWGRGPWPPVGAAPDSGWAAHVRRGGISTDPGCIRGASLEIPPRLGLPFPSGGLPPLCPRWGRLSLCTQHISGPPGCPWIRDASLWIPPRLGLQCPSEGFPPPGLGEAEPGTARCVCGSAGMDPDCRWIRGAFPGHPTHLRESGEAEPGTAQCMSGSFCLQVG